MLTGTPRANHLLKLLPAGIAAILILFILVPAAIAKRNDDVIVMKNGDRITGEIKRLEDGKLFISASYMSSDISVDWNQVQRLESKDQFNVYLTDGGTYTGVIGNNGESGDENRTFFIEAGDDDVRMNRADVIIIRPVEDTVWKQLTGSIDYGYNFTGGNNATTQSSLSALLAYRVQKWSMQVDGSSVFNSQSQGATTGRNTFSFLYGRKLSDRWYAGLLSELLNSQQQDLTLRATAGGGLGRILFRSERTSLSLLSGLLFSRERYSTSAGDQPQANNAEALFNLRYGTFRFKKFDLDATIYAYPSLTDRGRIRMGMQSALYIELYRNFKWKFSVYENFDSRPPVHAPKNDFGTGTSIGWTF
jgi:hypothetical protein